jgi:conjugal transfer pilus assembly protein TraF
MAMFATRIIFAAIAVCIAGSSLDSVLAQTSSDDDKADRFYCEERKLGTWFYCSKPKPKPKPEQSKPAPAQVPAVDQLALITRQLDELKAKAILDPNPQNIANYIRFQREQLDRAGTFADQWQRTIWANAELDYTLQRPVNALGKQMWTDSRNSAKAETLQHLGDRYGLYYFFGGNCGACKVQSPVLKSLSQQHGMDVMAISTDGRASSDFPAATVRPGLQEKFGLNKMVPAIVLFDAQTRKTQVIGYGVMAADEIMERIYVLTRTEVGHDF